MSTTATRHQYRQSRRARCKAHLSSFLATNPGIVTQEVALRFLTHGHHERDLEKFMASERAALACMQVPENIKAQARAIFRPVHAARVWKKKVAQRLAEKKRQRLARRIGRRVA